MALRPLENRPIVPRPTDSQSSVPAARGNVATARDGFGPAVRSSVASLSSPSAPKVDVSTIPDVAGLESQIASGQLNPLDANRAITAGYTQLASDFQNIVDPHFASSGTPPSSSTVYPNWFGFAPHASAEVGDGLLSASVAMQVLQGQGDPSQLPGPQGLGAKILGDALRALGIPSDVSTALGAMFGAGNIDALRDPRTLADTAKRAVSLLASAPGSTMNQKAQAIVRTVEDTLAQGNRQIYGDVGGAAQQYLTFRQGLSPVTPQAVLNGFHLAGTTPANAQAVYNYALAHAGQSPQPTDFSAQFPGMDDRNLMVAAFALYEKAGQTQDPTTKNQLVSMANNLTAYREQHDAVAPAFDPANTQPDEVNRGQLMAMLTPTVQLPIGNGVKWNFTDYAGSLPDRDHNPFTSKSTSYNWGNFSDRWPAILNAFQSAYQQPSAVWDMPPVLPNVGWWS